MAERRRNCEQPKQLQKTYPDWIGENLRNRKYFDMCIDSTAQLFQDAGDFVKDKTLLSRHAVKLTYASFILEAQAGKAGLFQNEDKSASQVLQEQYIQEAKKRGRITAIATPMGLLPFAGDKEEVINFINNLQSEVIQGKHDDVYDEVEKEIEDGLKVPMYPDQFSGSMFGRRLFDSAVSTYAKSENDPEHKEMHRDRLSGKIDLLVNVYARKYTSREEAKRSLIGNIIDESMNRDFVSREKTAVDNLLNELFPSQPQEKEKKRFWRRR